MSEFKGRVVTEWLQKPVKRHRKMKLVEEFAFLDSKKKLWTVPTDTVINGQSFPEWNKNKSWKYNLSRFIGYVTTKAMSWHPYVGNGRRASVVHDYYVDTEELDSQLTHDMFYDAMIADGQPKWLATIMYKAVKHFGPKW